MAKSLRVNLKKLPKNFKSYSLDQLESRSKYIAVVPEVLPVPGFTIPKIKRPQIDAETEPRPSHEIYTLDEIERMLSDKKKQMGIVAVVRNAAKQKRQTRIEKAPSAQLKLKAKKRINHLKNSIRICNYKIRQERKDNKGNPNKIFEANKPRIALLGNWQSCENQIQHLIDKEKLTDKGFQKILRKIAPRPKDFPDLEVVIRTEKSAKKN